jgi:VanZ family protein
MLLPHRLPRPLRLGLYALATAILLYLCLTPRDELPKEGLGDKPEHAIAWFVLTLTGYVLAPRRARAIPVYAILLGAIVEVLQASMGWGRDGDIRDLGADAVGVAVAVAVYWAGRRVSRA